MLLWPGPNASMTARPRAKPPVTKVLADFAVPLNVHLCLNRYPPRRVAREAFAICST